MAKRNEEFSWDATQEVGIVQVNDKKRVNVSFNMKEFDGEERWYVSLATEGFFARKTKGETEPTWHVNKNATFPLDTWSEIVALIQENTEEV